MPDNDIVSKVPLLYTGPLDEAIYLAANWMITLQTLGSMAAPGFMNPEGVVIYDSRSSQGFKRTFEYDEKGKGLPKDIDGNVIQRS